MIFLSKLAGFFLQPSIVLASLVILGLILITRFPRFGRRLASISIGLLLFVGLFPVGEFLVRPLEERFTKPDPAIRSTAHMAVLLGGTVQPRLMEGERPLALNAAAERLMEFDRLGLIEPELPLVISGGAGGLFESTAEAPLMRDWIVAGGVDETRIMIEDESRNTWENAQNTLAMLAPKLPKDTELTILIVTSAAHMPRAIGSFQQAAQGQGLTNLNFAAWPVDYRSSPITVLRVQRLGEGLASLDQAAREWLALTAYFLMGRIDRWLPMPGVENRPATDPI